MVSESTQGQNMIPNRFSHIYIYIYKSTCSINTVLFVNATIGFSENLFLVIYLLGQLRALYHTMRGKTRCRTDLLIYLLGEKVARGS